MNAAQLRPPPPDPAAPTVDQGNPWLGLASFTEETRAFFYGRDDEVAELARRVQRKLLTILFGQSGLGKTSILRAGLVPRLRDQGYCPVYVRIEYGREAPEAAVQIKQAIRRAASVSGEWTQVGVAADSESLWEFLHHRDDVLRTASGRNLIPLLIFDQFEEIFTLAQSDELGRARAARFVEELADLVENRPPRALERQLENDESAAERFDFARSDYRVLISLREDYLAPLEGLKTAMPSIAQNRLRLAPMTGSQALAAVLRPGGKLVSEEVGAAIVRFVAGGTELANAEVEPSLLSLICRELNDARLVQGRSEISLDLLAGSHATILSTFYERALADQSPAVRRIIEGDLLTESGFRENVAEENLVRRFTSAGAAPGTLAVLVNRRLLRVEERLDIRRVELTHDVLCGVVKSSRDQRLERESREATERLLVEQREREAAARRALVRARKVAGVCTILAVAALVAAVFAYFNAQRALRAEREAQQTRAVAEQARAQAEHLLGYLSDDFVRELESFGRLQVLAEFSQRQIDYFHALPPILKGPETIRNGALALVHHARAMRLLGELDAGTKDAAEAVRLLEQRRASGDNSEATVIALALAYNIKANILDNRNDPAGPAVGLSALELLQPLVDAPRASLAARRAYVEVAVRVGYEQTVQSHNDAAIEIERKNMAMAASLGALDLSNLDMAALYAESGAWRVTALVNLGRDAEVRQVGEDAGAVADKVLALRPGYRLALHAEQVIAGALAQAALNDLDPSEAFRFGVREEQISRTLLALDPNSVTSMNNLAVAHRQQGFALWAQGRLREAIPLFHKGLDDLAAASNRGNTLFLLARAANMVDIELREAQIGDSAQAAVTIHTGRQYLDQLRASEPAASFLPVLLDETESFAEAQLAFERGDLEAAERILSGAIPQVRAARPEGGFETTQRAIVLYVGTHIAGRTAFIRGKYAAAEQFEREALENRKVGGADNTSDLRDLGEIGTWLTMALARQGKLTEAVQTILPIVKLQRDLATRNHGDQWLPFELACALYAQSLADSRRSTALLHEAGSLLDKLPPSLSGLHDVRLWREWVRQGHLSTGV